MTRIGIIAGGGQLPHLLVKNLKEKNTPFHIIALKGFTADWIIEHAHTVVGLGQVGKLFKTLTTNNCENVVFAGHVSRPRLTSLLFDWTGLRTIITVVPLLKSGDNTLFKGIAKIFEDHGFRINRVQDYMDNYLAPKGILGKCKPSNQHYKDIRKGKTIIETISHLDIGQAVVIESGICQAIEAAPGTDNMLSNLANTKKKHRPVFGKEGGVMYKAPKKDQDMRLDIPTIGIQTVEHAYRAGLAGIAIKANEVFILELEQTILKADSYKMFIYGVDHT